MDYYWMGVIYTVYHCIFMLIWTAVNILHGLDYILQTIQKWYMFWFILYVLGWTRVNICIGLWMCARLVGRKYMCCIRASWTCAPKEVKKRQTVKRICSIRLSCCVIWDRGSIHHCLSIRLELEEINTDLHAAQRESAAPEEWYRCQEVALARYIWI